MKTLVALWRFVVDVALRWYHGGIGDLAAGVTFWILVSLPASILALLAALGWLDTLVGFDFRNEIRNDVLEFIERVFTTNGGGVREAVIALFDQPNTGLFTISLLVTVWSISRGFAGLIRALDDIYEVVDGRTWYHTRVVAVFLGFGSLLVSVPLVLMERLVWDSVPDGPLEGFGRGVVAVTVLVSWASTIYHYGPAQRSRWREELPGAIAAAVMWWLLSVGFSSYVSFASGANGVTAAIGAGLLALTWLWLSAQVLLIGGAINFLYGQRRDIARNRRTWNVTGELRRIVVPDRGRGVVDPAPTGNGHPVVRPVADDGRPMPPVPPTPPPHPAPSREPAPTGSLPVQPPPRGRR